MKKLVAFFVLCAVVSLNTFAQNKETLILLKTDKGNIKLKLYNETPKHRDNFIKLVNEKFYDGILFHRVIKDFMIQTGDPESKKAAKGTALGNGGPGYTIPAEFNSKFFHKKGALSAARQGDDINPKKESSGSQFYIVQGKVFSEQEIAQMEMNLNKQTKTQYYIAYINKPENKALYKKIDSLQRAQDVKAIDKIVTELDNTIGKDVKPILFTPEQKKIYSTVGGTPHLDGSYTVFGEVLEGLDIVEKISLVPVDGNNRPNDDLKIISAEILK
jgi:peptidylprolyl isomerase